MSYFDYQNVPNEPFVIYDQIDLHISPSGNDLLIYVHPDPNKQFFEYNIIYYTAHTTGRFRFPGGTSVTSHNYKSLGESGILPNVATATNFLALIPQIHDSYFIKRIKKTKTYVIDINEWHNVDVFFDGQRKEFMEYMHYDDKYVWSEPIVQGMILSIPVVAIQWGTWPGKEWVLPVYIKYDVGVLMNDYHRPTKVYYSEPNDLYQPDWSFLQPCLKTPGKRPFLPERYPYDLDHDNPSLPTDFTSRRQRRAYAKWREQGGTRQSSNSNTLQEFLKTWNSRRFSARTISTQ